MTCPSDRERCVIPLSPKSAPMTLVFHVTDIWNERAVVIRIPHFHSVAHCFQVAPGLSQNRQRLYHPGIAQTMITGEVLVLGCGSH